MAQPRCLSCVVGATKSSLPTTSSGAAYVPDEPFGVCANCHSLACVYHGYRHPAKARFRCFLCFPNELSASAAVNFQSSLALAIATQDQTTPRLLQDIMASYRLSTLPPHLWSLTSLDEFLLGNQVLEALRVFDQPFVEKILTCRFRDDALRTLADHPYLRVVLELPSESQRLLAAAVGIVYWGEIPESQVAPYLLQLRGIVQVE